MIRGKRPRLGWLAACPLLLALTAVVPAPVRGADQKQAVYCVRFSPDGKRLVTGGANRKVQVWELETGKELAAFDHPGWVQTVDFSPDGRYVLSGVRGTTLRIWDVDGNKMHKEFQHQGWVLTGLFMPDKKTVLSLGGDDSKAGKAGIRFWDLDAGGEARAFALPAGKDGKALGLCWGAISADGKVLASGGGLSVTIWDVEKGEVVRTLTGLKGNLWKLALSPDGQRCAAGALEKEFYVWNTKDGKLLRTIARPSGVRSLAFSPDGKLLADGGLNGQVTLWDSDKLTRIRDIAAHQMICESIDFSPNGLLLATGSFDNTVKVWSVKTGQQLRLLDGQPRAHLPPLPAGPSLKRDATSQPASTGGH